MMVDAWLLADKHIHYKGVKGLYCLSETHKDIVAYEKLTDEFLNSTIKNTDSDHPDMLAAKNLIERIMKRELYKCIHSEHVNKGHPWKNKTAHDIQESLRVFFTEEHTS